jgi:IS30 family transposase
MTKPQEGKIRRAPGLKQLIQQDLDRRWGPEQVSRVLHSAFPDEPDRRLAHETAYLPHRGGPAWNTGTVCCAPAAVPRAVVAAPMNAHALHRPEHLISRRPAEVAGRQVAGRGEGELVGKGSRPTIGTLVARTTRHVELCTCRTAVTPWCTPSDLPRTSPAH